MSTIAGALIFIALFAAFAWVEIRELGLALFITGVAFVLASLGLAILALHLLGVAA